MLFPNPLHHAIVTIIAQKPGLSVDELYTLLANDEKVSISLSQFYKVIKELVERYICKKQAGRIYLNALWIKEIETITQQFNAINNAKDIYELPRKQGASTMYFSDSLKNLDIIWSDLFAQLISKTDDKIYHFYDSRPYYVFGINDIEMGLYKLLDTRGSSIMQVFGNDSFMDEYGAKLIKMAQPNVHINTHTPFLKDGYSIGVIGDYTIEMLFPEEIISYTKRFFDTVEKIEDLDMDLFKSIFSMKTKCKITITFDELRAKNLKREIQKYYDEVL